MPYFLVTIPDHDAARTEILETLASYGARTRSEMLNAVMIIAFGLSALDMLAEAKAMEMSPSMRLRLRGCANNLNRSSQQNEQILARRLACEVPAPPPPAAEPIDDMPDAEFAAALRQTHAQIASYRNRLSGTRPATAPQPVPERNKRLGGSAIMNAFAEMVLPPHPTSVP